MGGSADAPQQTSSQKRAEKLSTALMEEQLKAAKNPIKLPDIKPPKPTPPPPPPASQTSADVAQEEENARRAAGRRTNTARGTLFAGETGGYQGGTPKTLLG